MANRIKTRFRIDWDNDTYTNLKVATNLIPNLVPYAPYVEGMGGRSSLNGVTVDTAIKDNDDVGFTALVTDASVYDWQEYGVNLSKNVTPSGESPNVFKIPKHMSDVTFVPIPSTEAPIEAPVYTKSADSATGITITSGYVDLPYTSSVGWQISGYVRFKITGMDTSPAPTQVSLKYDYVVADLDVGDDSGDLETLIDIADYTGGAWSNWYPVANAVFLHPSDDKISLSLTATTDVGTHTKVEVEFTSPLVIPVSTTQYNGDNLTVAAVANCSVAWNGGTSQYDVTSISNTTHSIRFDLPSGILYDTPFMIRTDYRVHTTISSQSHRHTYRSKITTTEIFSEFFDENWFPTTFYDLSGLTPNKNDPFTSPYEGDIEGDTLQLTIERTRFSFDITNWSMSGLTFDVVDFVLDNWWSDAEDYEVLDAPLTLPSGSAHNFSIHMKASIAQNVAVAIYNINVVTGVYTSIATDTYAVTTGYKRFATVIPSQAGTVYLYVRLTPSNTSSTVYSKGMQVTTGSGVVEYHVGELSGYDDITEYVVTADWTIGRDNYDAPIAYEGTMNLTLNNDSQLFSPSNTASPLYGALEQNRRIALEVYYNGSWHPLWTGWTSKFNVKAGRTNNRQVDLECMQGMYRLREGEFSSSVEHDVYLHDIVYSLVARSGWLSAKSPFGFVLNTNGVMGVTTYLPTTGDLFTVFDVGRQSIGTVGMDWGRETNVEAALKEVLTSEYAKLMIGRDGGLILHNRLRIATPIASAAGSVTLDTDVTDAEYVYGENILNRIEVMTKPKKEVKGEVIWETQSPVYLNGIIKRQRKRNKRKKRQNRRRKPDEVTAYVPMHFTFEEQRQRTITNINSTMGSMTITVTNARNGRVMAESEWSGQIWVAVLSDGGNKYSLQIRNNFNGAVYVNVQVTGDYYEGGQGQSYVYEDEESQEQLGAVFYELREITVMEGEEQAQALAQLDLARRSKPQGEIKSMEFSSYDEETMITMMSYTVGDILNISEKQSGMSNIPHQIIGEKGSYASGDVLRLSYDTAHMNIPEYTVIDTGVCRARTNLSPYPNIMDADFTTTNKMKVDVVALLSDAGEKAWKLEAYTNQAMAWFGGGNAEVFYSYNRRQRYNDYATNLLSAIKSQPTISLYEYSLPRHIQAAGWYHPSIGELTGGGTSTPTASFPKIMQFGTWWFAATVYGTACNINWQSSEGDIWGTPTFNETRARSYGNVASQTAKREYYNPYYNSKLFLYLYPITGGVDDYYISDITAVNLQNLENTHLEASTQYTVSVWGQSEFGKTTDIAIIAVEHDGSATPTEHVVTLTLGEYGKYTGTFTTTASCETVSLGIRWDDTVIPPVPCYITGFSITESSVSDLDEANEILPTAMRLFV